MAKEKHQVIGTFKTKTTDNKNHDENIRLAAEAIDGMVLKPGEEFSFNNATGNHTTLYNAVIKSGYQATERNFPSFAPGYIEKGQDAMVSFDGYAGHGPSSITAGYAAGKR